MSRKRMIIWPLVAILVAAGIYYRQSVYRKPPPEPAAKVVFITGGSGPYWRLTVDGAKAAAAKEHVDLRVDVKALALARAAELKRKAKELDAMRRSLEHLAERCHGDDRPDCPILVDLEGKD